MRILTGASGNDPKNDFELFLKNYSWILCLVVVVIIISTLLIIFVIKNKKKSKPVKQISEASSDEWISALGGQENILEVMATGSRLSIKLKNTELVNREELTKLGVTSVVMMSDKITLVTNLDNQKIVEKLQKSLQIAD